MQARGSTNKWPIKLRVTENKLTRWFVYKWGKPIRQKPPPDDFKVTIPENPLLSKQVVTSKPLPQYLIPTYSWTLTPIPNWTCLVVTISPFDARLPSTWLTNCADPNTRLQSPTREDCWLQSSSIHSHDEDQEDNWSQNSTVHIHSNFFKRDELGQKFFSGHNLLEQTILKTYATYVLFDSP